MIRRMRPSCYRSSRTIRRSRSRGRTVPGSSIVWCAICAWRWPISTCRKFARRWGGSRSCSDGSGVARGARSARPHVWSRRNFSLARRVPLDVSISIWPTRSSRTCRRAGREFPRSRSVAPTSDFPFRRPRSSALLGRRVQDARGWKVDLSKPALTIGVELLPKEAFYYFGKLPGRAGCPMGTAGRVVGAALGRHRLAGRGVAHDETRLRDDARSLSQLSVPVAHLAGQGARAGGGCSRAISCARGSISCPSESCSGRSR